MQGRGSAARVTQRVDGGDPVFRAAFERAEQALKEKQKLLWLHQEVLGTISQAIAIADASSPEHPVIYANPAFERITGYSPEESLGRNWRFLEGPATDPDTLVQMRADMLEGRRFQGELVYHRKDGSSYVGELVITPIRDEPGGLTHFVCVMEDITARRNLEAQLTQALKVEAS
jgi:two-component system, cell cycle sensor histidine kinase and response regulator CckA